MLLYTLQHKSVWETLVKEGEYMTDINYICEPSFIEAYKWLNQVAYKYKPHWFGDRPVWCWTKRPDMRKQKFIFDKDKPLEQDYVILTLEVPEQFILLTHFGLWHSVLNGFPVSLNEPEDNQWDKKLETYEMNCLPKHLEQEKQNSWEQIIYNNGFSQTWDEEYVGKQEDLQAIIPSIKLNMLVKTEHVKLINKYKSNK